MNSTKALAKIPATTRAALVLALATLLSACHREQISVYPAPKDSAPQAEAQNDNQTPPADPTAAPRPEVGWKLPPGWTENGPDGVSLQNFSVTNADGQKAFISLTQLGDLSGKDALLVNMWRQQVGLPALDDDAAVKTVSTAQFGPGQGNYFEVLGSNDGKPWEIITGFMHTPQGSWFCKMVGNPDFVASQKPVFLDFLKTIVIKETAVASAPAAPAAPPAAAAPNWTVPSQWQPVAPGDMQVAVFHVPDQDNAKAEVSVSVFPGEAGGTLANVNRWRTKYVGLSPVTEQDLPQLISPLDPATPGSVLVDLKNNNKRLIGAIVPRAGNYWFYKINGDDAAVAPQKEAFIAFAKSNP